MNLRQISVNAVIAWFAAFNKILHVYSNVISPPLSIGAAAGLDVGVSGANNTSENTCGGGNTTTNSIVEILAPEIERPYLIPIRIANGMSIEIELEPYPTVNVVDFSIKLINKTNPILEKNEVLLVIAGRRHQPSRLGVGINSFLGGAWGPEEGTTDKLIFPTCQTSIVRITPTKEHFLISVNGQYFYNYKYRGQGLSQVSHIYVSRGTFYKIRFEPAPPEPKEEDQVKFLELRVNALEKCVCKFNTTS